MIDCDCRRTDALCDRCVDDGYKQLSGVDGRLRERLAVEWLRWATRPTSS